MNLSIGRATEIALSWAQEEPVKAHWEAMTYDALQEAGDDRDAATVKLTRALRREIRAEADELPEGFLKEELVYSLDNVDYFLVAEYLVGAVKAAEKRDGWQKVSVSVCR